MDNCKHVTRITPSRDHSILNPQNWLCAECGTTESVWACLSCSHVACGRFIEEHALKHYKETKHPLALEVNEKYLYCYDCDDYILNDNAAGDIKILRGCLTAIATLTFPEDRGHHRLLRSQSFTGSGSSKSEEKRLYDEDLSYTALWFRRYYLLARVFNSWKECTSSLKKKAQPPAKPATSVDQSPPSLAPRRKKRAITPGVTGLRNLGNTCYMNSILQVLSHLEEFRKGLLRLTGGEDSADNSPTVTPAKSAPSPNDTVRPSRSATSLRTTQEKPVKYDRQTTLECFQHLNEGIVKKGGLNGGGSSSTKAKCVHKTLAANTTTNPIFLHQELLALLRVMWSGKWALVSPHQMLYAIWRLIPFFKGYAQQDAQEFLCEFLDKLQSELEKLEQSSSLVLPVKTPPKRSPKNSAVSLLNETAHLVENTFQGELISEITYLRCGHKSQTYEPFMDLSLEFPTRYQNKTNSGGPSSPACHVTEMLSKFTEAEKLDGCIYTCDECNKNRPKRRSTIRSEASKMLKINRLPRVIRLHLKRFMWGGRNNRGKIPAHVQFDQELDMGPFCQDASLDRRARLYNLVAVVMHHGRGFGSGHYTAHVWSEEAESWLHCNDSRLEMCRLEDVLLSQAYIMVYSRADLKTPDNLSPHLPVTEAAFEQRADDDITFNFKNSTIPKFVELKRKLEDDKELNPKLKRYKSTLW